MRNPNRAIANAFIPAVNIVFLRRQGMPSRTRENTGARAKLLGNPAWEVLLRFASPELRRDGVV